MKEIVLTKDNFEEEVLKSDLPVLVDFWATWCGPCKMVAPTISEIAGEMAGKLKVGKVDVDNDPELAAQFGIMSIPTLIMFKDGKEHGKIIGVQPKETILAML